MVNDVRLAADWEGTTDNMHAEVQLFGEAGLVRVFEDGKGYGDAYVWAATVHLVGNGTIEILGSCKVPTWPMIRALQIAFVEMGLRFAAWERIKDGKVHLVKMRLRKRTKH